MSPDIIVVANRWDGQGARLCAVLNALSVARALGLDFRFVWRRTADWALAEPRELFDDVFLERFEIDESICDNRVALSDPTGLNLADARKLCREASASSVIYIDECFNVVAFADESAEAAQARFRAGLTEIGWSRTVQELIASVSIDEYPRGYSAIHVRAGDIVNGVWRQFVPVEKYLPTAYVEFAIETLSGPDRDPVVLLSDNGPYARHLKCRFDQITFPDDSVPGYSDLTEAQRAFADILVLSRARRIVGPRASAFSRFGAHLGGLPVLGVDDLTTEDNARRLLRDGIARDEEEVERSEVLPPLLARDICWFLDVFSDDLPISEQLALAQRAVKYEPDFCGALNRSAATLALAGHYRESRRTSLRALTAAAKVDRHADPLVESLATSVSAEVLAFGTQRHGGRRLLEWLGPGSVFGRLWSSRDLNAVLDDLEQSLARCEKLEPFQIDHYDVIRNLRFQIAALAWLTTADHPSNEIARTAIKAADNDPPFLRSWRPSGFGKLPATGLFPHVLRNLEVTTIRIAQAIGTALSSAPSRPPPRGYVDGMTTCSSGLRWVHGWAYDSDADGAPTAVGYVCGDAVSSGGAISLPRPDVAEGLGDPRALNCGFAFPVPLAKIGDLQSNLRIFSGQPLALKKFSLI